MDDFRNFQPFGEIKSRLRGPPRPPTAAGCICQWSPTSAAKSAVKCCQQLKKPANRRGKSYGKGCFHTSFLWGWVTQVTGKPEKYTEKPFGTVRNMFWDGGCSVVCGMRLIRRPWKGD
jgi:hypothetical protein